MRQTTAVILAAGEGKRIKPIVTPKPLIPFMNKPMIEWIMDDFKSVGIKKFVLIVNLDHQKEFAKYKAKNIQLAIQKKPTGMAGAVLPASKLLTTSSMIVVNANDLISQRTYKHFIKTIKKHKKHPAVTGLKVKKAYHGGYFKIKDNKVVGIVEKPAKGYEPSPYANLVLHYFPNAQEFIKLIKNSKSKKDDLYEVALDKLMQQQTVGLVITEDSFAQIKYPHQILDATSILLKERLNQKKAIHSTAKIMAGAVIKNSYIGPNVIIGNNCLIRDSIIEADSVVGYNTEIARSYVGPQSYFHCNYVGDSVIEGSSNMGSGARLANLRFDEKEILLRKDKDKIETQKTKLGAILGKGVKLGINTSIMPGITIGENSIIGSGVVLNDSVKTDSKVFVKQSLTS
ncbi:sugar phosphate nucleotidyltransferase [Patescibacteria group bacterium]